MVPSKSNVGGSEFTRRGKTIELPNLTRVINIYNINGVEYQMDGMDPTGRTIMKNYQTGQVLYLTEAEMKAYTRQQTVFNEKPIDGGNTLAGMMNMQKGPSIK